MARGFDIQNKFTKIGAIMRTNVVYRLGIVFTVLLRNVEVHESKFVTAADELPRILCAETCYHQRWAVDVDVDAYAWVFHKSRQEAMLQVHDENRSPLPRPFGHNERPWGRFLHGQTSERGLQYAAD